MTLEIIRSMLAWCTVINFGLLLFWVVFFMLGRDFIYRYHGKWCKLSEERFDAIHYKGMLFFKICIFMFNLVPYLALRIVG